MDDYEDMGYDMEADEGDYEPFDRDGWDDEWALASAGHGMDESYQIGGDSDPWGEY